MVNLVTRVKDELASLVALDAFGDTRSATALVSTRIGQLGADLGFTAAYPGSGGWLYDVCWLDYADFNTRRLRRLVMALESEWDRSEVELAIDFNKLLQSRAGFCVMVYQMYVTGRSDFTIENRLEQFRQAVKTYEHGEKLTILFAGFRQEEWDFVFHLKEPGKPLREY